MNAHINFQTLLGEDGKPAFVVVPYNEFRRMAGGFTPGTIPNAVVGMVFDGPMSATKAWREYLRLTQAEVPLAWASRRRHTPRWSRPNARAR